MESRHRQRMYHNRVDWHFGSHRALETDRAPKHRYQTTLVAGSLFPHHLGSCNSPLRSLRNDTAHCHMSTAQFKKRTTHLDLPGNFCDLYQHVVKTCPFCNSVKFRPERSRVSGLRAEEFGDLIFLDHGSAKIG